MMIPSSQAMVISAFPLRQRGLAMGIYTGASMVFLAIIPLIGGTLVEDLAWYWVFFVNVPLGAMALIFTFVAKPQDVRAGGGHHPDVLGAILLSAGLSLVVAALMQSASWGWASPWTTGLLAAGLALVLVFVKTELRRKEPLIELRIMRYGNFATDVAILFMAQFALMGMTVFGAIYSQEVLGFSPITGSAAFLPLTIPILLVAPPIGMLYDRWGPRPLVSLGCALMATAMLHVALVTMRIEYLWLVPGLILFGIGIALIMAPANTDAMNSAPGGLRGQASGVIQTFRYIGGTVGIAVLSTIILSTSSGQTADRIEAAGFRAEQHEQVERMIAFFKHGGQAPGEPTPPEVASIPKEVADKVEQAFKEGFSGGLQIGYVVVSGLLFASSVLAAKRLRRVHFAEEGGLSGPPSGSRRAVELVVQE